MATFGEASQPAQHSLRRSAGERRRKPCGEPCHPQSTPLPVAAWLTRLSGWRLLLGALLAGCVLLHHLLPTAWAHARVVAHARMIHLRHATLLMTLRLWLLWSLLSDGWQSSTKRRGYRQCQNGAKDVVVHADSPNGTLQSSFIPILQMRSGKQQLLTKFARLDGPVACFRHAAAAVPSAMSGTYDLESRTNRAAGATPLPTFRTAFVTGWSPRQIAVTPQAVHSEA